MALIPGIALQFLLQYLNVFLSDIKLSLFIWKNEIFIILLSKWTIKSNISFMKMYNIRRQSHKNWKENQTIQKGKHRQYK